MRLMPMKRIDYVADGGDSGGGGQSNYRYLVELRPRRLLENGKAI